MKTVTWGAIWRPFPGPAGLAVWITATVPAPLVFFDITHRWEEDQSVMAALSWSLVALPMLAASAASRWAEHTGRHDTIPAFACAVVVGVLVGEVYLALSMAVYRWIIPLSGAPNWSVIQVGGVVFAAAGAAIGYAAGPRLRRRQSWGRRGYLIGAVIAAVGAFLAPVTVRLGAEDSTIRYDEGRYGGLGPDYASGGGSGALTLPAAGRYAILAVGFAPHDPDCRITGQGATARSADLVTIPPADYGGDAASYAWVASFAVPAAGTYALTCRTANPQAASYAVGDIPQIRGAVGAVIHWPLPVIWLLGVLPGVLVLADTAMRRRAHGKPGP